MNRILGKRRVSSSNGLHNIVKKAEQCQQCNELADSTEDLVKKDCLGSPKSVNDLSELPAHPAQGEVKDRPATPAAPAPPMQVDLDDELQKAQEHLKILEAFAGRFRARTAVACTKYECWFLGSK